MQDIIFQDKNRFVLIDKNFGIYYKSNQIFGKSFDYSPCKYCGKMISNSGWANINHYKMHKDNGDLEIDEQKNKCRLCEKPQTKNTATDSLRKVMFNKKTLSFVKDSSSPRLTLIEMERLDNGENYLCSNRTNCRQRQSYRKNLDNANSIEHSIIEGNTLIAEEFSLKRENRSKTTYYKEGITFSDFCIEDALYHQSIEWLFPVLMEMVKTHNITITWKDGKCCIQSEEIMDVLWKVAPIRTINMNNNQSDVFTIWSCIIEILKLKKLKK